MKRVPWWLWDKQHFLESMSQTVTGWKAERATGTLGFRNELTPDQPWGKNWPSDQYFPLMKKQPAIMMNTHTARFSTLSTLLKPTEFFTPSATMMVTMTAITKARRSGYDCFPFPRVERHELILSREKKSQAYPGASALSSEKGGQFVTEGEGTVCVRECVFASTVVHRCLFANGKVLVYRWGGLISWTKNWDTWYDNYSSAYGTIAWNIQSQDCPRTSRCIYGSDMLFELFYLHCCLVYSPYISLC